MVNKNDTFTVMHSGDMMFASALKSPISLTGLTPESSHHNWYILDEKTLEKETIPDFATTGIRTPVLDSTKFNSDGTVMTIHFIQPNDVDDPYFDVLDNQNNIVAANKTDYFDINIEPGLQNVGWTARYHSGSGTLTIPAFTAPLPD